jgi:hypothetical protein
MKKTRIIKLFGLFISVVLIAVLIAGCEKDPEGPTTFTITTSVSGEVDGGTINPLGEKPLEAGRSIRVNIKPERGFDYTLFVNDIEVDTTGHDYYLIDGIEDDYDIRVNFEKGPLWWQMYYLEKGPWKPISWQRRNVNATEWNLTVLPPELPDEVVVFDPKTLRNITYRSDKIVGDIPYIVYDGYLDIGGGFINYIIEVDEETLILEFVSKYYYWDDQGNPQPDPSKNSIVRITHKRI